MPFLNRVRLGAASAPVVFVLAAALHGGAHAQVKYFEQVPSVDAVMSALGAAPKPAAAASAAHGPFKARGLEWSVGAASSGATAAAPAPAGGQAVAMPVNFDSGTARLTRASLPYVETVVAALGRSPELRLMVEGHTDAAGNDRANILLSWERAMAVFRLMVEKYGIDPSRLQPVGKGSSELYFANEPLHGMNRRVQFRVIE